MPPAAPTLAPPAAAVAVLAAIVEFVVVSTPDSLTTPPPTLIPVPWLPTIDESEIVVGPPLFTAPPRAPRGAAPVARSPGAADERMLSEPLASCTTAPPISPDVLVAVLSEKVHPVIVKLPPPEVGDTSAPPAASDTDVVAWFPLNVQFDRFNAPAPSW